MEREEWMEEQMKSFKQLLYIGTGAAVTIVVQVLGQFLFNTFSSLKLPYDSWAMVDIANAMVNMTVFTLLIQIEPKMWLQSSYQSYISAMFVIMLVISWFRFILFMTLVKKFSILLLTMIKMVSDSQNFFTLMVMLFFIFVVIFQTLFQEVSIHYVNFTMTFRTLFDAMLGNFSHYG